MLSKYLTYKNSCQMILLVIIITNNNSDFTYLYFNENYFIISLLTKMLADGLKLDILKIVKKIYYY